MGHESEPGEDEAKFVKRIWRREIPEVRQRGVVSETLGRVEGVSSMASIAPALLRRRSCFRGESKGALLG